MDDKGASILRIIILLIVLNILLPSDKRLHKKFLEETEDNENKYESSIDEYDKSLEDYAIYLNSLNLNDIEVIMKIIDDEWKEYTYGDPDEFITGYCRLSLKKEKKGVCREFADDFTAKINAVNKEYNASNLVCYADSDELDDNTKIVDIDRNIDEDTLNTSLFTKMFSKLFTKMYGNHVVSIIHIPEKKYMLVVDPTNLLIGVVDDGEIYLFNDSNEKGILTYKYPGNYILCGDNYITQEEIDTDIEENIDSLSKLYGYDAQKTALESIKEKEKVYKK